MPKQFSLENRSPYPHIKIPRERFPRFLATRHLQADEADYYGAFLTKTAVRILMDFLNRTFRLRNCDIDIDGTFPVPCTQFYRKRCVAPCVKTLCSEEQHRDIAEMLQVFLRNDREQFRDQVGRKIRHSADALEFERATYWRDVLKAVEVYWQNPRWQVWLDDAVDTFSVERAGAGINVYLVTQRRQHILGKHIFVVPDAARNEPSDVLREIIDQLYRYHAPREIRVSNDFSGRKELALQLSERSARPVKITVVSEDKATVTAQRAFAKSRAEAQLANATLIANPAQIGGELKDIIRLKRVPKRVEAIDVSHISGSGIVAAASVWHAKFQTREYDFHVSNAESELAAMEEFVSLRYLVDNRNLPDLVLVDGGASQMAAAIKGLKSYPRRTFSLIAAAKPPGKHSQISHFLTEAGHRIEFSASSSAHLLLQALRDDAHELANYVHREYRDAAHFYEASGVRPLVVPIRFVAEDADADDLRPIVTKDRSATGISRQKKRTSRSLYRPSGRAGSD